MSAARKKFEVEVDRRKVEVELYKVIDPEVGVSIMEMKLLDKLEINDGKVSVEYHATTPYCPPVFALEISRQIKDRVSKLQGVSAVSVVMSGHYMSEFINKSINQPQTAQPKTAD
jgi:metal-sulfur cluster biosynthetic enzyme